MEGRGLDAVAHLALLGLKTQEPAFWGTYDDKSQTICDSKKAA